jgi:hypothetical protein
VSLFCDKNISSLYVAAMPFSVAIRQQQNAQSLPLASRPTAIFGTIRTASEFLQEEHQSAGLRVSPMFETLRRD